MLVVAAAVFVLLPIALISGYLILRTLPFAMGEPTSVEPLESAGAPPPAADAIERLGFSLIGRMNYEAPGKKAPASWQWAFRSDDRTTLAVFGTVNSSAKSAFVTVWPDGSVVVSRWPRFLWIRERRAGLSLATTNPSVDEAHSRHREGVTASTPSRGVPMVVADIASAQASLEVGSRTFRAQLGRGSRTALALTVIGLAVTMTALIHR